jgi:ABC1 atypical kinase-like domain
MRSDTIPPQLRALLDAAASLARSAPTARLALAALDGLVDPDAVPAPRRERVAASLARASAGAPAQLAPNEVERALRRAWGRPPGRVLDALELERPLAAGALGQVHAARLDGAPVTVELRRPELERAVRADLALLDGLAPPLRTAFPALDVAAWLRAVREQALDELDLEHAAGLQRRVARAVRDVDGLVVPAVHGALAAPGVLVADRLAGPTLADERPDDPARAARVLLAAHVTAARAGIAPVNPRPEHVVLLGAGRLGLLGTGAAVPVDRPRVEAWLRALAAVRGEQAGALARALAADLGVLATEDAEAALALARGIFGALATGPARLDAATLAAAGGRALDALPAVFDLVRRGSPVPEDAALARMLGQLALVLARLEANEDWLAPAATRPPARAGPRSPRSERRP